MADGPAHARHLDQYGLWESDFFKPFKPIADITGGDRNVAQTLAQQLDPMLGFALLTAVDTYTYRSDAVMLSTAQSYRPGRASEQHHVSQATLDENAIVFTTHPKNEPQSGTAWPDEDGYWTGNGSLPRAAQHGALSMSLYAPVFENPGPPLDRLRLPAIHPRVLPAGAVQRGRAVGGMDVRAQGERLRRALLVAARALAHVRGPGDLHARSAAALRPRGRWRRRQRVADPSRRLVAIRNFAAFRAAVLAHPVQVAARPAVGALAGGFDVSYESPTEGAVSFGTTGPLRVKGADVALDTGKRYDNPWALADFGASAITIADTAGALKLDFAHGSRVTSVTGR